MDKLSYGQYGLVVIISAFIISLFFGLVPHFIVLTIVYLFTRARFHEPIHAYGLNICYVATMLFYVLIFVTVKICNQLIDERLVFAMLVALVVLSTFATSTVPTKLEKLGKIFFGYKKEESKYQRLIDFIKFNGLDDKLLESEEKLKKLDSKMYIIYKRKFRENKTFSEISKEFDLDNPRIVEILDKCYFYMIGALNI